MVGVGEDRVRGRQYRDRADELARVPHIALHGADRLGVRPVRLILGRTAGAGPQPRAFTGPLVLFRLVGEQDDVEPQPGGRGKKAENDRVGRFGSNQAKPHSILRVSLG